HVDGDRAVQQPGVPGRRGVRVLQGRRVHGPAPPPAVRRRRRDRTQPRANAREMISRWIWLVPSTICSTFASRMYRSTGWSATYPYPPSTWTASVVTFIATSVANSFALAASTVYGWPASLSLAAYSVSARAAEIWVAASASRNPSPWN